MHTHTKFLRCAVYFIFQAHSNLDWPHLNLARLVATMLASIRLHHAAQVLVTTEIVWEGQGIWDSSLWLTASCMAYSRCSANVCWTERQKTCRADARVHKQRGIIEVTQVPLGPQPREEMGVCLLGLLLWGPFQATSLVPRALGPAVPLMQKDHITGQAREQEGGRTLAFIVHSFPFGKAPQMCRFTLLCFIFQHSWV